MIRTSEAKKAFKGSCGHTIDQGRRMVIFDKPHFLCSRCGKEEVQHWMERLQGDLKK